MAGSRILIVDDDADFLEIFSTRIRSWGYETLISSNGNDAVERVRSGEADLVVLDYLMPEMNGIETLKEVRGIAPEIPVIMLTSNPDMYSIGGAEALGISAYVPKTGVFTDSADSLKAAIEMALAENKG